jgi:hypothetical protein
MGAPTSNLQNLLELQIQQNNEKKNEFQNPKL